MGAIEGSNKVFHDTVFYLLYALDRNVLYGDAIDGEVPMRIRVPQPSHVAMQLVYPFLKASKKGIKVNQARSEIMHGTHFQVPEIEGVIGSILREGFINPA